MNLAAYDFDLPQALIAQHPPVTRTEARLLVPSAQGSQHLTVKNIVELLQPTDLLVLNNTRVEPARLLGHKATGGAVEVLIERVLSTHTALAHVRASKSPKPGTVLEFAGGKLEVSAREEDLFVLEANSGVSIETLMQTCGHIPLPPYIERADEAADAERYQTVYAAVPGAVAAPTAGLHFDEALLERIAAKGVDIRDLTLHVGAGTFQPIRGEDVNQHVMHAERIDIPQATVDAINATRSRGGRVVAVGTTVVRALEAAAKQHWPLTAFNGETRLFIREGFEFRVVDALLTNFHLPRSTLLMLVCAFAGYNKVMAAYDEAVREQYRFFSYGDAMLLERAPAAGH